jgi:biopolymer transport protein ExbD
MEKLFKRLSLKIIAMAEIMTGPVNRHQRKRNSRKNLSVRTDMTPMVDLGFLLITFFVFTAEISKPKALNLNMPADGEPVKLAKSTALTMLLADNDIAYYYEGAWEEAKKADKIIATKLSAAGGLGDIIRNKQKYLDAHPVNNEKREGLMLLIKPGKQSSYKNVVDAMDEALIHEVKKYAVIKMSSEEADFLSAKEN